MTQDAMEFLAGAGYGAVKGIAKSVAPQSHGLFKYSDDCIKNVSPTALMSSYLGEFVGKALLVIVLL